jgi:hypothetical protein
MEGATNKAFGALGQFPLVQGAVGLLILLGGVFLFFRASMDRTGPRGASRSRYG